MKNTQKVFIVPILIAIIVVLVIVCGFFIYKTNTSDDSPVAIIDSSTQVQTQTTSLPESSVNTTNSVKTTQNVTSKAKAFLELMKINFQANTQIKPFVVSNINGYRLDLSQEVFNKVDTYLSSKLTKPNTGQYTSERGYGYLGNGLICWSVGLGSGSSPSDSPYVWCGDK